MTTYQIFISIVGAAYAAALLFMTLASVRDWRLGDIADEPPARYCRPGARCRLCATARKADQAHQEAELGQPALS